MELRTLFLAAAVSCAAVPALPAAEEPAAIALPAPQTGGGKPLMQALKERKTSREISGRELPQQLLSDLLWAAAGINRPSSLKRTAPSARNWQEIGVYVATPKGLYLYEAGPNSLKQLAARDVRLDSGLQPAAQSAPVLLLYVADSQKMTGAPPEERDFYAAADTGYISQNVYLFCASENLATVVMGGIDREKLAKEMALGPEQKVMLVQAVGYPKEAPKPAKVEVSTPAAAGQ